jgi:hypothetical protein
MSSILNRPRGLPHPGANRFSFPWPLALLLALVLLAGCSTASAPAPESPAPTVAATPAPSTPSAAVLTATLETATPATLPAVQIGELATYNHPDGIFSLDVPVAWEASDSSTDDLTRVIFLHPEGIALIVAAVVPLDNRMGSAGAADADELLRSDVQATFGTERSFQASEPVHRADGRIGLSFDFETTVQGITAPFQGIGVLQPGDSYAALLYIVLPQTQTDLLSSRAEQMINSLKVTSPAPPTPEVAVGGDWQTYTYPGGLFTLDIPADWEATTGSAPDEARARFSNPEGTAWVELSITEADAALSGVEREALLATYAEEAIGENRNFEMAEQVVPQPDDSLLLSFAYQRDRDSKVFLSRSR